MARSRGRAGRPWRTAREQALAASSTCWICGHGGARTVDHEPALIELERLGLDPCDQQYLRVAHGSGDHRNGGNPCPTCRRYCNQSKGTKTVLPPAPTSRAW